MIFQIDKGKLLHASDENKGKDFIQIMERKQMIAQLHQEDAFDRVIARVLENDSLRFESHEGVDVLCIHLHTDLHKDRQVAIHIFVRKKELRFVCEHSELIDKQLERLINYDNHDWTLEKVLYASLDNFLTGESERLDALQDEITELEDNVITNHGDSDTIRKIIHLRKRLLRQERCYEQMQDVLDHIKFNANKLFSVSIMSGFELMSGHVDRLMGRVQTLQDYVTEIREAYQAEVDINLNVTMRIFTVITAVFLPLTLVVGWYGMNLKMPEYEYDLAYPILITVSVLVIIALLMYFKKHRWF